MKKKPTRLVGQEKESLAQAYLITQGMKLVTSNFQCKFGEIDLIMYDGNTLVFVEVRYRHNQSHGGALASITPNKCKKIINTAHVYLQRTKNLCDCRFDVIVNLNTIPDWRWIKNAFTL